MSCSQEPLINFNIILQIWPVCLMLVFTENFTPKTNKSVLEAQLRRPEGQPSGAPYPYEKENEIYELFLSWLSWLVVLLVDAYAQRQGRRRRSRATWGHTPNNSLTEICSLGLPCTSLILDINVMINWNLSKQGIRWPISHDHNTGSSLQLIKVTCFFLVLNIDHCPSARFRLDRGLMSSKLVKNRAGLFRRRLTPTQDFNFLFHTDAFFCFVLCIRPLFKF